MEINSNFKDLLRSLNEGGVSLDDLIAAKQAAGRRKIACRSGSYVPPKHATYDEAIQDYALPLKL